MILLLLLLLLLSGTTTSSSAFVAVVVSSWKGSFSVAVLMITLLRRACCSANSCLPASFFFFFERTRYFWLDRLFFSWGSGDCARLFKTARPVSKKKKAAGRQALSQKKGFGVDVETLFHPVASKQVGWVYTASTLSRPFEGDGSVDVK
jgi:hypothetical protein